MHEMRATYSFAISVTYSCCVKIHVLNVVLTRYYAVGSVQKCLASFLHLPLISDSSVCFFWEKKNIYKQKKKIYVDYYFKGKWNGYFTATNILPIRILILLIHAMVKDLGCYLSKLSHSVLNGKCCTSVFYLQNVELSIPQCRIVQMHYLALSERLYQ